MILNPSDRKILKPGTLKTTPASGKHGISINPDARMSYSPPVPWSKIEAALPQTPVPPQKLSSADLVLRCQAGLQPDRAAFSELLRRYQPHVDRVLYHLAPDWSDRADLAQEVWLRVYRHLHRLKEPEKFRGWLSRIATNLFYDELRKRKRDRAPVSLDATRQLDDGELDWEIASPDPSPEENLSSQEFYEKLREAIADLPEAFRTTIILREIEDLPYEQIAEMTGVSLGTVKSRIARARARLQTQLQNYLSH